MFFYQNLFRMYKILNMKNKIINERIQKKWTWDHLPIKIKNLYYKSYIYFIYKK